MKRTNPGALYRDAGCRVVLSLELDLSQIEISPKPRRN
jgi:hypothetical protein